MGKDQTVKIVPSIFILIRIYCWQSAHFKIYPLSLHTLGAEKGKYLYLAQLLATAESIYQIRLIARRWVRLQTL